MSGAIPDNKDDQAYWNENENWIELYIPTIRAVWTACYFFCSCMLYWLHEASSKVEEPQQEL